MLYYNTPKVSIVIPIYNVEKYIKQCAESIFEQTYPNLEIIFVNDKTNDDSIDILMHTLDNYPSRAEQTIVINHETNKGLATARNTGIKNCTGLYVICIDSDDYIDKNMITNLMQIAVTNDYDIVAASFYINTPDWQKAIPITDCNNFFDLNHSPIDTLHFSLCNKIIKRKILEKILDVPNINCWEDLAVTARAFALTTNAKAVNIPMYHYQVNPKSLTSQGHKRRLHDQIIVARFIEEWFKANNLDKKYAQFLKNMKFSAKIKFLRGNERDFAAWKHTFPETNNGILHYSHIPLHYRIMFFIAHILPASLCQWISDTFSSSKQP